MPRRKVYKKYKRINMCLDDKLARWVFKYAEDNSTTLTALVANYISKLRERSRDSDVEQI